ncbi:MAG: sulfatase-like hydrolase/transferase [Pirellulales bacterium]
MKRTLVGLVCLLQVYAFGAATVFADRPNIVFMLSDDQGWNGTSVQMHPSVNESKSKQYRTPNLGKLASQGMRFSQGYSPAPVCSPTRISLQTGKSPAQLHWTKAAPPVEGMKLTEPKLIKSIAREEATIAELLRSSGYATAHYGKWHISGGGPGEHGYDEHDGDTGNENAFKFVDPNPVDIFGMADRAKQFMAKSKASGKPFFIQLSWNALHAAENASNSALEKYKQQMSGANDKAIATAAITEDLDRGVGQVMSAIDQLGLAESTFVIYMSDNGAGGGGAGGGGNVGGRRAGLRGGKGGVWEGGLRVPLIVRGPGVASNSWCHVPVVGYDLFPTFCQWAGIPANKLPNNIEGGSIGDLLSHNGQGDVHRKFPGLVFHFPHYQGESPQSSILMGNLKLVHFYEDNTDSLFDLSQDISEHNDLAKSKSQETVKLRKQLEAYLAAVDAQLPTLNPNFDPKSQPSTQEMRGKRGSGGGGQNNKPKNKG